ncbi:Small ubiquitin-related modifier 2, partial [Mucuna pruriens]
MTKIERRTWLQDLRENAEMMWLLMLTISASQSEIRQILSSHFYVLCCTPSKEGRQLFFKVVQDLELVKVFKDFCDRRNMEYETVRFLYDGAHINGRQTPKMLNMENGAEIFAARQQLGGGVATLLYSHVFNRSF